MAATELLLKIQADVSAAQRGVAQLREQLVQLKRDATLKPDFSFDAIKRSFAQGVEQLKSNFRAGMQDISTGVLGQLATNLGTLANPAGLATAAIAGLGTAIAQGFREYQRFNDALTNLSVITGVSGDQLQQLGDTAREMALTFGGDASNQLDLMSQVLSKFGPALAQNEEALSGFVERVNIFAKATGQDAATAGDQLMNVMLQLGVNVNDSAELLSESTHIMDVLAKAAQEGAAETSQLAESYLQVGSTAKQLGFSVEQVSAALEAMAFGGKTGAEAGVGLRNVLTSLVRPTNESAQVLAQLGLSQQQVAEKMRTGGIAGVVEQLSIGLQRLGGDTERAAALARIFGKENLAAAGALINNLDKLKDLQSKIQSGSQGAALAQAQTRMQSLSEILGRLKTAATEVLSALGEAVVRIASSFGVVFGDASGSVASFVESLRSGINTVADVLIALTTPMRAAWAAVFGYISGFISSIVDAFKDVAAQVSAALGSLGSSNTTDVLSSFIAALRTVAEWIGRVAGAISGLSIRAIGYFITAIVTVVRHTVEWIRNNAALQAVLQVVSFWVQQAVANIMQMVNWIGRLLGIIGKSTEAKKQESDATQEQSQAQAQAAESARQASTNYAALAAQLERVVAASQRYVSAVQQYVQLATKAEALGRGLAQPTTEQQLRANAIQLQAVLDQLRKLSSATGTKNIIEEMLATPLELSADAAARWVEMLARANPIVVKASKDIEDAGDNTDVAAKAQDKYRDALAKARDEAAKLVGQVVQLRVQGQELELKLRTEQLKQQLDDAIKDAEGVEITIDLALDETRSNAVLQRLRDSIASLRTQLAAVQPESDAARAIEATLDKLVALEAKTQEQIAQKRREGLQIRKQLEIDAIADEDERQRQASLRRIDAEEQEALERARIVQASEETILALKQRYAAERERILNRLTEAERAQQEATKASSDAAFSAIVDSLAVLGDKSKDAMDNFKRTVLAAFLDIAQAQLSVAIFGATAQEVATKGFVGLGTAAVLAAILQGLFAAAKAAVQRGFKVGGWTGEGSTDDVAGIVHKREYVVPAPYAERYRPILELMRRGAYEPALAVTPQQQRVRVVVDGSIDVRARDDWMDVARSITLRRRYAV